MTIYTHKQTQSSWLVPRGACTLFFLFAALCGITNAQSTDPANPTPITTA